MQSFVWMLWNFPVDIKDQDQALYLRQKLILNSRFSGKKLKLSSKLYIVTV